MISAKKLRIRTFLVLFFVLCNNIFCYLLYHIPIKFQRVHIKCLRELSGLGFNKSLQVVLVCFQV